MRSWKKRLVVTALVVGLVGGTTVWGQQPAGTAAPGTTTPAPAAPATTAPKAAPAAAKAVGAKVNINTADEAALMTVKGIGKGRAKAIIDYRQKNGPFKTVDDLTKVKGIKEKALNRIKDQVTVE